MIEDILVFALGFCAATLFALLCLPALWNRALRLTRDRLSRLVPLSEAETAAERDWLRAEAAVTQRRLEQRLETAERGVAAKAVELGRRTVALVAAENARDRLAADVAELKRDVSAATEKLFAAETLQGALQFGFDDLTLELESVARGRSALAQDLARSELHGERQRGEIASLQTAHDGLAARLGDLADEMRRARAEADARVSVAEREREAARAEASLIVSQRDALDLRLKNEIEHATQQRLHLQDKTEALLRAERQMAEQEEKLADSALALAALEERFQTLRERLFDAGKQPAGLDGAEIDRLRSEISSTADHALVVLNGAGRKDAAPVAAQER